MNDPLHDMTDNDIVTLNLVVFKRVALGFIAAYERKTGVSKKTRSEKLVEILNQPFVKEFMDSNTLKE